MKIVSQVLIVLLIFFQAIGFKKLDTEDNINRDEGLQLNQIIEVSGIERAYHLYVPNNPKNAPMVLLFHGNRGSYNQLLGLKRGKSAYKIWLAIAKRENTILVVPNGVRGSNRHRGWNDCRSDADTNPKLDDVLFTSYLIDFIVQTYGANANKVYALGTSNGGQMAIRLAQEIPEKLTVFAAIVAANPVNSKCAESDIPISALFMNGTLDPILPYDGGEMASNRGEVQSAAETIDYWVKRNKTDTIPVATQFIDDTTKDCSKVEKQIFPNGKNNTEVAFFKVINGGHNEPSKKERFRKFYLSIVGNQNADIEMADEVWNFFKTKSK